MSRFRMMFTLSPILEHQWHRCILPVHAFKNKKRLLIDDNVAVEKKKVRRDFNRWEEVVDFTGKHSANARINLSGESNPHADVGIITRLANLKRLESVSVNRSMFWAVGGLENKPHPTRCTLSSWAAQTSCIIQTRRSAAQTARKGRRGNAECLNVSSEAKRQARSGKHWRA